MSKPPASITMPKELEVPGDIYDNTCMMNKAILVQTQYLENYGAHSEDGKHESGNAYWKFKGGEEYLVYGCGDRAANAMALVAALCMRNDLYMKEYPIGYEVVDADYQPEEEWRADYIKCIHIDKKETWKKGDYDYDSSMEATCAMFSR